MNNEIETGGPAFPGNTNIGSFKGMTLRDWFAGMALSGINAAETIEDGLSTNARAIWAYEIADEMLFRREVDSD